MRDVNKKFSVRYYLNLVLVDEEERRYFKQQVRFVGKAELLAVLVCLSVRPLGLVLSIHLSVLSNI